MYGLSLFGERVPAEPQQKVIYLDQFAISEFHNVDSNTLSPTGKNKDFWAEFVRLAKRAYLLQQVIFPASNIHKDETIVAPSATELSLAHEMMGGETSFEAVHKISAEHEHLFAEAYISGLNTPQLSSNVDDILDGERNAWISAIHVTATMDYSMFAEGLRQRKSVAQKAFEN